MPVPTPTPEEAGAERATSQARIEQLIARGAIVHSPASTIVGADVDPQRIEAGVELYPGVTLRGARTLLGSGTQLGKAGGGYFEDVCAGRHVKLYGGFFQDVTLLDGVCLRGHAELRGGTLLEEGCEGAHHVGYKMTVMLPYVVAGSLVNFCDALFAGGRGRSDHSEIGSALALYNFTPWGDKFASLFGDVPRGVFLRENRVFVGGQTQVISPVEVGFGATIAAGSPVRRNVPPDTLYSEATARFSLAFDAERYPALKPKFEATARFVGNLQALKLWYEAVRLPAARDARQAQLYRSGLRQIEAGIDERVKRLGKLVKKLPRSLEKHRASPESPARRQRIAEHELAIARWAAWEAGLRTPPSLDASALASIAERLKRDLEAQPERSFVDAVVQLDAQHVAAGTQCLQACVDAVAGAVAFSMIEPHWDEEKQ